MCRLPASDASAHAPAAPGPIRAKHVNSGAASGFAWPSMGQLTAFSASGAASGLATGLASALALTCLSLHYVHITDQLLFCCLRDPLFHYGVECIPALPIPRMFGRGPSCIFLTSLSFVDTALHTLYIRAVQSMVCIVYFEAASCLSMCCTADDMHCILRICVVLINIKFTRINTLVCICAGDAACSCR